MAAVIGWLLVSLCAAAPLDAGLYEEAIRAMKMTLMTKDQPPLWSRLGMALARAGRYDEALVAFSFGEGLYYEQAAIPDHADALRGLGRCEEAMALRRSGLLTARDEAATSALYVGLVDDALGCGKPALAIEIGDEALAFAPDSAPVYAAISDAWRALQEQVEADWHLRVANDLSPEDSRVKVANLRAFAAEGRWSEINAMLPRLRGPEVRLPAVFVARVQLALAQTRMRDAVSLYQDEIWARSEDPAVIAYRAIIAERFALKELRAPPSRTPPRVSRPPGL